MLVDWYDCNIVFLEKESILKNRPSQTDWEGLFISTVRASESHVLFAAVQ